MVVDLHSPVVCRRVGCSRGGAVGCDVVSHVSIDAEHLLLCLLSLKERKVRRARLLDADASGGHVNHTFVVGEGEHLRCRFGRHVLPQVAIRASTLEDERFDRQNFVPASERRGRVVDRLLFRRRLRAAGNHGGC